MAFPEHPQPVTSRLKGTPPWGPFTKRCAITEKESMSTAYVVARLAGDDRAILGSVVLVQTLNHAVAEMHRLPLRTPIAIGPVLQHGVG